MIASRLDGDEALHPREEPAWRHDVRFAEGVELARVLDDTGDAGQFAEGGGFQICRTSGDENLR